MQRNFLLKKRGNFIFHFVLYLILISTSFQNCSDRKIIKAKDGVLNLKDYDFKKDGVLSLDGEWDFFYNKLLTPEDFANESLTPTPSAKITVPGTWNGMVVNSETLSGDGYSTYRLRINSISIDKINFLALKFNYAATAAKVFLNGKLIYEQGIVGMSAKNSTPSYLNDLKIFEASENIDLIIQVSNFFHRKGGLWQRIRFGTDQDILELNSFALFYDFFLFGVLCIMTIYHLGLFILRREEKTYFFFALFCFIISVRILFTGETWITTLVRNIEWELQVKIEYITFYFSTPAFASFVYYLYPDQFNKKVRYLMNFIGSIFILIVILTPAMFSSQTIPYYQVFTIICGIYCMGALIRAILKKKVGAIAASIGWGIFFLSIIGDIVFNELYGSSFLAPFGLFIFIFSQSFILSVIFSQTFRKSISLTEHLKSTNLAYSRFVPTDFIDFLKKDDITEVSLGDQIKTEMTVMFVDIRRFSTLSETMTPEDTFKFLNAYLRRVGPIIRKNHGFIDKFMGDGIMALFSKEPEDALRSAVEMQNAVREYNISRMKSNFLPIEIGIGIHIGSLMLGTIGESDRMDATVISDAVNLASRLEGLTKVYGSPILISDETFNRIVNQDLYNYRMLGRVQVKGKKESVGILEIIEGNSFSMAENKLGSKPMFEKAIFYYLQKDFTAASNIFKAISDVNPEDIASKLFYNRSENFTKFPPSDDWNGVEVFEIK